MLAYLHGCIHVAGQHAFRDGVADFLAFYRARRHRPLLLLRPFLERHARTWYWVISLRHMDLAHAGGEKQREIPKVREGIHAEPINVDELHALGEDILVDLDYSALRNEKRNVATRRESMKSDKLYSQHLKESSHGAVIVARDGEKIIGVLTLNRKNGVGVIDDIWLRDAHHQERVIETLLEVAKEHLLNGLVRCGHAVIKADHPSEELRRVYHSADVATRDFFSLEAKDN